MNTPPLPTDTGQTAPAPASGDVVVVSRNALKDVLVELAGLHRHYQTCGIFRSNGDCDCGMADTIRSLQAMLSSAPRPSGDVAAKLGEIQKRHEQLRGTGFVDFTAPSQMREAHADRAYLLERIATLEQQVTHWAKQWSDERDNADNDRQNFQQTIATLIDQRDSLLRDMQASEKAMDEARYE